MFIQKFLIIVLCLSLAACLSKQATKDDKSSEIKIDAQTASTNIENLLKKQILLTNNAEFSGDRMLEGASGFLIKYNNANFAVTARHLLGEDGGVEPSVSVEQLKTGVFRKWEMKPRVVTNAAKETVKLSAEGSDFSQSSNDIVLLKVVSKDFEIELLDPSFEIPANGEPLFLIGCPYSQENCKQNSYQLKFVEFDEAKNELVCEINSTVDLRGFSGAPVVNGKGEAVGVLVSGGASGGKTYAIATSIKEIQKIKF
jgi:hypothetical protein